MKKGKKSQKNNIRDNLDKLSKSTFELAVAKLEGKVEDTENLEKKAMQVLQKELNRSRQIDIIKEKFDQGYSPNDLEMPALGMIRIELGLLDGQ